MKFQSNSIFNGTITANSVADAGTNTDKFLVLNSGGVVTYRTAAELYADLGVGSSSAAYTSTLKHQVKAGEAINKGQAVYVSSANGTNMIVTKASNTAESTSSKTMGLLETTLALNGIGNVITEGLLSGLDTTGATNAGDPVWLGTSGNLIYGLINKPYAPANLVFIGIVTRVNVSNGEIFVKVQNGFEIEELHDVDLKTTTPINGHILGYNGTLWVNKTIAGWLGFTPVTNARTLTINGTAYDLSADRSWTISSMIYPSAGIAVSTGTGWGTSITDNSTNWNTAYTNRITSLTTTGSSGAATLTSNTLNIPTYTLAGLGGVATSRTLTINGTAYDLSADRSWTIDSTSASTRTIQKFTATSGQTTFTITGGYTVGMVDVYMNGVKLDNATDFTASNGTTVVLAAGALTNSIIEVYKFGSQFIPNNALRVVTSFTATAAQTTFTVNYSVGLVDVYYNGSCLAQSEYTATNGTSIILATACQVNDIVVVYAYSYSVGAYSGIGGSGTSGQVPYFTSSAAIASSPNHFWDATNNRLGIGTNSPVNVLHIVGDSNSIYQQAATTGASVYWDIRNSAGTRRGYLGYGGTSSPDMTIYNTESGGGIKFGTSSVLSMLITSSGSVGINSASPASKLEIVSTNQGNSVTYGSIFNVTTATAINDRLNINFSQNGNNDRARAGIGAVAELANGYASSLAFYTRSAADGSGLATTDERMRIASNGQITTSNAPSGDWGMIVRNANTASGTSYGLKILAGTDSDLAFQIGNAANTTNLFRVTGGGNVLINQTTDQVSTWKLQVTGLVRFNDMLIFPTAAAANGGDVYIGPGSKYTGSLTANDFLILNQGSSGAGTVQITAGAVANGVYLAYNANSWSARSSDVRNKKDFETTQGLSEVLQIEPVKYKYIWDEEGQTKRLGFTAQNLQSLIPEMVIATGKKADDGSDYLTITPDYLLPVLVKAIQELSAEVEALKAKIK